MYEIATGGKSLKNDSIIYVVNKNLHKQFWSVNRSLIYPS